MFVFTKQRLSLFILISVLFISASPDGCYAESAVIPIQYRWASEALPIINPFLSPAGVAIIDERTNALIIVDTPDSIKKIKDFLQHFDQPVKRVRIRLKFNEDQSTREQSLSVGGRISEGQWGVGVGEKKKEGVDVRISDSEGSGRQESEYIVHTTSGSTAFILTGKEIPYRESWRRYCQSSAVCPDSISFQKADSGMEVKTIIVGDRANVEITPRLSNFEPDDRRGIVRYSAAATQLSVPLGQWVTIGGTDKKNSEAFREIIGGGRGSRQSSFSMEMMVETY
ncbi:MAG: secretin N-terminal domain-containing protein [Desulfobacterales bacterium]|nr:secretin N-terminal domain-containing protein [Desulfobacterales bacterium]